MKKVKRLRKGELKELHLKESDIVDKTPCGNGEWSVDINDKILCIAWHETKADELVRVLKRFKSCFYYAGNDESDQPAVTYVIKPDTEIEFWFGKIDGYSITLDGKEWIVDTFERGGFGEFYTILQELRRCLVRSRNDKQG